MEFRSVQELGLPLSLLKAELDSFRELPQERVEDLRDFLVSLSEASSLYEERWHSYRRFVA